MNALRRPGTLVVVAAVVVHVALLVVARTRTGTIDRYAFRSLDSREYYTIARNLTERAAFSQADPADGDEPTPDTWRTPGYPALLALVMLMLGSSLAVLVIVQQVLSILNVWLVYRIARTMMAERRAGITAGLFLIEPYHLYYSLWLLATTWFTTVLLLTWLTWSHVCAEPQRAKRSTWKAYTPAALLGALSGFLVLVRPIALLIPPLLFTGLLISGLLSLRHDARVAQRYMISAAAVLALAGLVVGSWAARNAVVAGRFALSDQSGVVLAYFKAAEVELWRRGRAADRYLETSLDPSMRDAPHTVWPEIDHRLRERLDHLPQEQRQQLRWPNLAQGNRTPADSFEVSRALARIAWKMLAADPLSTLTCCVARCGAILTFPLNLALNPPNGVEVNRARSALLSAPYLLLTLAALMRLLRGSNRFCCVYFPAVCTVALLVATTPQVDPRFRAVMIPTLVVIALLPWPEPRAAEENAERQECSSESSEGSSS